MRLATAAPLSGVRAIEDLASPRQSYACVRRLCTVLCTSRRVEAKKEGTRDAASPSCLSSSGGRIRTSDLRVMSPTSYQAALPRDLVTDSRFASASVKESGGKSCRSSCGAKQDVCLLFEPGQAEAAFEQALERHGV